MVPRHEDRPPIAAARSRSSAPASSPSARSRANEWRYFGGDKAFTRYSPLDQINRDNVKNLQVVWRRPAVDDKLKQAFPDLSVGSYLRSTPIMIDGMLYTQDAHGFVSAFDPGTGTTVWQQEPFARTQEEVDRPEHARRRLLARRQRSADPRRPRRVSLRAEREDRQDLPGLRRQGTGQPAFRREPAAGRALQRQHRPDRRRQRRRRHRQHGRRRRRRPEERSGARGRPRLRREDRQAAVDVSRRAAGGRIRQRHLGQRVVEDRRRSRLVESDDARTSSSATSTFRSPRRPRRRMAAGGPAPTSTPRASSRSTRRPASACGTSR